jgi:hypothetical protein
MSNEIVYIKNGDLYNVVRFFVDTQASDNVTITIQRVSDNYKWNFTSLAFTPSGTTGTMSFITGTTAWLASFTPPSTDSYIVIVINSTLDITESFELKSVGIIPNAGTTTGSAVYCAKADISGLGDEFTIPSAWSDSDIDNLIIAIQEDVNDWLDDDFTGTKTLTLIVDGTGDGILFTRPHTKMPIVQLSLIVWRESNLVAFDPAINSWSTVDYYANKYYVEATGKDYRGSARYFTKSKFIKGIRNYEIIGTFGHSAVPNYVKQMTVMLCRERIQQGYLASLDINSEAWVDYKVTFASNKKDVPVYSGFPTIDAIISRKRNKSLFLMKA